MQSSSVQQLFSCLILLCLWLTGSDARPTQFQRYCDQCECILSEDTTEPKGITNVKAKCKEGRIEWDNPYGAIRLDINPGYSGDYRGCVLIKSEYTTVRLSQETRTGLKHLETIQGLSKEICLTASSSASVMLYIELVPESSNKYSGLSRVYIDYDIERIYKKLYFDPLEECRPCSEDELLRAYCSSDYVIEGKIISVEHRGDVNETSIEVQANRIIQQSKKDLFKRRKRSSRSLQGTIIAHKKCGVEKGRGTFLLMGSIKLGRMRLGCAPFLEDWERIQQIAVENETMECSFD